MGRLVPFRRRKTASQTPPRPFRTVLLDTWANYGQEDKVSEHPRATPCPISTFERTINPELRFRAVLTVHCGRCSSIVTRPTGSVDHSVVRGIPPHESLWPDLQPDHPTLRCTLAND